MALEATDFADIAARGLFISEMANASAVNESTLLNSGYVADAKVMGAFANEAASVSFPVFNATNVTAQTLPADGTPVANSATATETYVTETCSDKIIPYRYMPGAAARGLGGVAGHLERMSGHVGKVIAATVEADLVTKAGTAATAADSVVSDFIAANITRKAITQSCTGVWGSSWKRADSAIIVHPDVYSDILNLPEYVSAAGSSLRDLSGAPIESYMGMALIVNDYINVTDATDDVYDNIIVKRGTLQYFFNALRNFQEVHIPGSGSNQIDMTFSYALHSSQNYLYQPIILKTLAGKAA